MADQTISDTQIEAAAKAYCVAQELDPEELVWSEYPVQSLPTQSKLWQMEAVKIRKYLAFQEALRGAGIFL